MVAFHGSHVVVTGGTGALGSAVVAALRAAGAVCHVTNMVAAELEKYPHRNDPGVHVTTGLDLADEAAVRRFFAGLPALWGSLHLPRGLPESPRGRAPAGRFPPPLPHDRLAAGPLPRPPLPPRRHRPAA